MKNRIIQSLLLIGMMVSLSAPSFKETVPCSHDLSTETETEHIENIAENTEVSVVTREETLVEMATIQMTEELEKLESISDKKEWFLLYKDIVDKYSYILDTPETIYEYYTDEEIYLVQRVIETECFEQSFESKVNVAAVVLNRIENGKFGDSVREVITKTNPKQFVYWRKNITEDTKLALEYAFEIEDTTGGCVAFRSDKKIAKWGSWTYQFSDGTHYFYK